jgi:CHASE2 domain-containing sensor protein/two-component sensor histidine kinase
MFRRSGLGPKARRRYPILTRLMAEWIVVGLLASLLAVTLARTPLANPFDRALYDQLTRLRPHKPSDRVLIVAIDDSSLAELGPWPWPRKTHAALIDRLTTAGVGAVAYDVMFLEPDPKGDDAALATSLRRSGRTVLPLLQVSPGEMGRAVRSIPPLPALATGAAMLGQVNIAPDADGVVRRVSSRVADNGVCWLQLALAARAVAEHAPADAACAALATESRRAGFLLGAPAELIPFAGAPGRFRTVSAAAVVRGEVPPEFLKDRIVLVGATAAGLGDRYPTASSGVKGGISGVELQANLLDASLRGARMALIPAAGVVGAALLLVWLMLVGLFRLAPRLGLPLLFGLAAVAFLGSGLAFAGGWWLSPLPALAGLGLAYPLWSWRRLAITSDALGRELARFDEAGESHGIVGADALSRQLISLEQATERLRRLHRMVAQTLQSLPDPTVAVDQDRIVRLDNDQARAIAGGLDPIDRPLAQWLTAALGPRTGQAALAAIDGGEMPAELTVGEQSFELGQSMIQALGEGAPWTIVRLTDVTTIRRAVRQREDALQLLTHDIRAPFASISALIGASAGAPTTTLLQRIETYAARGRALAESYVQWSRAENADTRSELFSLGDAAIDAADEAWSRAGQRGITLETNTPDEEILVLGDRSLVTRALINLIDNAIRHSAEGGGVEVVCTVVSEYAICEVHDRGLGVATELIPKLFRRFSRPEGDQQTSGAGLGLAMVALVAQRMGGAATYHPRDGGGAIFRLTLPIAHE